MEAVAVSKKHRWLSTQEKLLVLEHRYVYGKSAQMTADCLLISKRTVQRYCARFIAGDLFLNTRVPTRFKLTDIHLDSLKIALMVDCTFTLNELGIILVLQHHIHVHKSTIGRALARIGYTHKRVTNIPRQCCDLTVAYFFNWIHAHGIRIPQLFFLDESGFDARLVNRDWGWSPRGERAITRNKTTRGIRYTLIATATAQGLFDYVIIDGTTKAATFFVYVVAVLYHRLPPNAILVLDNATVHRSNMFRIVLLFLGIDILYLPPYAPHLNLVEYVFALLKSYMAKYRALEVFQVDTALPIICDLLIAEQFDYTSLLTRLGY